MQVVCYGRTVRLGHDWLLITTRTNGQHKQRCVLILLSGEFTGA